MIALLGAALLITALPPVTGNADPGSPAAGAGAAAGTAAHTVTLITGDTVTLADGRVRITAGPGRQQIRFHGHRVKDRLTVIPGDAMPLIGSGRLDPRLFDVSRLVHYGYDQRRSDLPLIVTGGNPAAARSRAAAVPGARVARGVPGGSALTIAKPQLTAAWTTLKAGGEKVSLDGLYRPSLAASVPRIGAPAAWSAGLTGTGVTVAVVDSGIDATHPDLAGRVVTAQDFTGDGDVLDRDGHGTHVAATIASTGAAPGGHRGVAPDARLLAAKACTVQGCFESAIVAGMEWAATQGAKVVNVSLGGYDSEEEDPVEAAVNRLSAEHGVLFVVAAGNDGPSAGTVGSPGSATSALTVGAVAADDTLAGFSARGPRAGGGALKPDITAPGVDITAARSSTGVRGEAGAVHVPLSGTSMAAPHVAGAAALLAQQHPQWTGAQLKAALMGSATPRAGTPVLGQGAGRVDVARAIGQQVLADPPSVDFGRHEFPHAAPLTRTVTYRNTGTAPVTYELTVTGAPFTVTPSSVTVAAGGAAEVTLTAGTGAAEIGHLSGYLTARASGGSTVVTPLGVQRMPEMFDVTVSHLDPAGAPTNRYLTHLVNLADGTTHGVFGYFGEPTFTARLPRGRYALDTDIYDGTKGTILVQPEFDLDRDRSVTFDARVAGAVTAGVPQAGAQIAAASVEAVVRGDGDVLISTFGSGQSFDALRVGQVDPAQRSPRLTSSFTAQFLAGPAEQVSPYAYHVAWSVPTVLPNGTDRRFTARELATVDARYSTQGLPKGAFSAWAMFPGGGGGHAALAAVDLPGRRTEYYSTVDGVKWLNETLEMTDFGLPMSLQFSDPATYRAAHRTIEVRNRAVSGPGFNPTYPVPDAARVGDEMRVGSWLFSPPGHAGTRRGDLGEVSTTYRTVVERDGQVIADEPSDVVFLTGLPADEHRYTVTATGTVTGGWRLSTSVRAQWTFTSARTPTDRYTMLPLQAVRFAPVLDEAGTAPAGRPFLLPITVQRMPGAAPKLVRSLEAEISFDDGATWRTVRVDRLGGTWLAKVQHPAGAGFVSLRAKVSDTGGNTGSVTVIRAYEIK